VSDLNDPRVLFAAERTLLAWVRTASGMMAMGFLIDRGAVMTSGAAHAPGFALAIGLGFVLGGVLLSSLSVVQYRRSIASLRPAEIPAHYWTNLAVFTSAVVGALGLALAGYLVVAR
jgi:putative membrane protein